MLLRKGNSVLLGHRLSKFGGGKLCFPGGHVEMFETAEVAVRRETIEECGLKVGKVEMIGFTEDLYRKENKHYITIFFLGEYIGGDPVTMEPEKIDQWKWYEISDLKKMKRKLWKPALSKFKILGWL